MQQPLTEHFIAELANNIDLSLPEQNVREAICIAIKSSVRSATYASAIMCAVFVKDKDDRQKIVDYAKGNTDIWGMNLLEDE